MSRNSFPMKVNFSTAQNITTAANNVTAPKPMGAQTYAVQINATSSTWILMSDPTAGAAVASASQTVATPGVFTTAVQAYTAGTPVFLTGIAPGGFSLNTVYYIIALGLTTTALELSATFGGTGIQCTASAICTINPINVATASNSMLIKSTDYAMQFGVSPGQFLSTLQQTATGTVNVVELTH